MWQCHFSSSFANDAKSDQKEKYTWLFRYVKMVGKCLLQQEQEIDAISWWRDIGGLVMNQFCFSDFIPYSSFFLLCD
jgi:hypothetical protein